MNYMKINRLNVSDVYEQRIHLFDLLGQKY